MRFEENCLVSLLIDSKLNWNEGIRRILCNSKLEESLIVLIYFIGILFLLGMVICIGCGGIIYDLKRFK